MVMNISKIIILLSIFLVYVNCAESEFSTCFHHFECINFTTEWFDPYLRPENLPPLERHVINTKFLLLTSSPESNTICYDPITAIAEDIKITAYENHLALLILIHDFTSNGYTGWIKHAAKQVIPQDRYNIISVDWQEGAEPPFDQAISNARVVAMEVKMLITTLINEFDLIPGSVHLMGHGVGAHIAGYVGKAISGLIGRITALDPTGPRFEGMPDVVHLDYKDALYVEVIHTDGDGSDHQGTLQPFGNIDIYFNNGSYQPGCRQHDSIYNILTVRRDDFKPGTVVPDCSHKRAFKYYLNSIFEISCKFLAIPIEIPENSVITCAPHKTEVKCVSIGLDVDTKLYANQVHAKFHVKTNSCKPFCLNIYQIEILFAKCPEAEEEMTGYFIMGLDVGDQGRTNLTFNKDSNDSHVILLGQRQIFTVHEAGMPFEEFHAVNLTWHFTTPFCYLCRNATCISEMRITHIRPYINAGDAPYTYTFCPREGNHTILYDHKLNDNFIQCNKQRQ